MRFFVLVTAMMAISGVVKAQTSNFSGNWQLDKGRTELGNVPASAISASLEVHQQKDSIFIDRIGIIRVLEGLPIVGGPTQVNFPGGSKLASIEFIDNGSKMLENSTYTMNGTGQGVVYPAKSTESWTLADNNHTLQIMRTVEMTNSSSYSVKAVYTKQD